MEKITINIFTDTAAMERAPATEIAEVLRRLAAKFEHAGGPDYAMEYLHDSCGHVCGTVAVQPTED